MVDVQVGPRNVVAAEDFDVGKLFRGRVLKTLKLLTRDDQTAAIINLKNDQVQ